MNLELESLHRGYENPFVDEILKRIDFRPADMTKFDASLIKKGKPQVYNTQAYSVERRSHFGRDVYIYPHQGFVVYSMDIPSGTSLIGGPDGVARFTCTGEDCISFHYGKSFSGGPLKFFVGLKGPPNEQRRCCGRRC